MKYDLTVKNMYGVNTIGELTREKAIYLEEVTLELESLIHEFTSKNQRTIFIIALEPRKDLE